MAIEIRKSNGKKYVEVQKGTPVNTEDDALNLAALCGENDTNLLLFDIETLPEEFFNLKTGLAGAVLQKFSNYRIKAGCIIPGDMIKGRFREMVIEANRSNQFRVFENRSDAENWLTK